MKYALNDLIDIPALQRLMEKLYAATGINHALIDNESKVHTAVGWQRICTDFHRVNPRTRAHCLKSDLYIKEHLHDGPYASYRCPHGLIDNAVPLIIDGEHLANLFTGQMLHTPPDLGFFREQARIYGFDEEAYVQAAGEIPIIPRERLPDIMGFLSDLAQTLAQSGLARLRQLEEERLRASVARELEEERLRAAEAVRQHRNMLAQIMDSVPQSIFWKDLEGRYIGCNAVFAKAAGLTSPEDVVGKTDFDLPWPREEAEAYRAEDCAVTASNQPRLHITEPLQQADGSRLWVDTSKIPLVDADGRPYGVLGVCEDITERKLAEEELAAKVAEIERFNRLAVDRELRILELKRRLDPGMQPPEPPAPPLPDTAERSEVQSLSELIDRQQMQSLFDSYCDVTGIASAIIDLKGEVFVAARWQRICTDFHRRHPVTCTRCIESDTSLAAELKAGEPCTIYTCRNGLKDAAAPIVINGRHIAKIIIGQFFLSAPDLDFFRRQALEFGFDEADYLAAVSQVPVISEAKIPAILQFMNNCANTIALMGAERARLSQRTAELRRQQQAALGLAEDATEARRQAEAAQQALAQSERQFRTIVDTANEGIWMMDRERTLFVNAKMAALLGYTTNDFVGKTPLEFMFEEDHGQFLEAMKRRHAGEAQSYERRFRHKKGHAVWTLAAATPVYDDQNRLAGSFAMFTDITERKRTEDALRLSEKKFGTIFRENPVPLAVSEYETGRFLELNEAALKMMRAEMSEQMIGRTSLEIGMVTPEERSKIIDRVSKFGYAHRLEIGMKRLDGEPFVTELTSTSYELLGKRFLLTCIIDITESKQSEDEVRRLRNLLSNIINSMPSVLIGVDAAGSVTQWNAEAERTTGVVSEAAIGRSLADVFPAFASEMSRVKTAIEKRTALRDTTVAVQLSDQVRYSDVTIYPLVANCIEGAVIRIDDITERVRMEEMMIQTEKMMSVGGLAAGMAHEINNPLAGIMQNLQVLELYLTADTPKNRNIAAECGLPYEGLQCFLAKRDVQAIIASIQSSSKRAAKIVGNMLSFSRKSDKGFTENDIAELLDKTIELAANDYDLKKKYDFRQIEIVREYAPAPKILCETSQIQQVLLNILKNGAHAMAGHTGERRRFVLRIRPMEDALRIEIQDTGPGMDESTRKRVFEPFFTTKEIGLGTGLGLSVSYFIITENHGGSMDVTSIPGEGSTFIVTLPYRKENQ